MKKIIIIALLSLIYNLSHGQELMDNLVNKTCECLNEKKLTKLTEAQMEVELGGCLIEASVPYMDRIKSELGIDLAKGENEGRKFGESIGLKLVTDCPEFMRIIMLTKAEASENAVTSIRGKLLKVEKGEIAYIIVKEEETKREVKLLWWGHFIDSELLIKDSKRFTGKMVNVEYREVEAFHPKMEEYVTRKEITSLEVE